MLVKNVFKNKFRQFYLIYIILLLFITAIILLLSSKYSYLNNTIKLLFRAGFIGILCYIVFSIILLISIIRNPLNAVSDERERLIIQKSAAVCGIIAFTLSPIVMMFILILPDYLQIASFIYLAMIGATFKISILVYNKKF